MSDLRRLKKEIWKLSLNLENFTTDNLRIELQEICNHLAFDMDEIYALQEQKEDIANSLLEVINYLDDMKNNHAPAPMQMAIDAIRSEATKVLNKDTSDD